MKTILAPMLNADNAALEAAIAIGRFHRSHIHCLHPRAASAALAMAALSPSVSSGGALSVASLETLEHDDTQRAKAAHALFSETCRKQAVEVRQHATTSHVLSASYGERKGDPAFLITKYARYHDLVVLGRKDIEGFLTRGEVGDIILGCGRPVLLVPGGKSQKPASTIAIAWKDTVEAARAMSAAMPLLENADQVVLLAGEEGEDVKKLMEKAERAATYLRWHGLTVNVRCVIPGDDTIPQALADACKEARADMMVMGAYGHGRGRETLFGGVTNSVLRGFNLPVLLVH